MPAGAEKRDAKIEFKIENEGRKVTINRIFVNGNEKTDTAAVLKGAHARNPASCSAPPTFTRASKIFTAATHFLASRSTRSPRATRPTAAAASTSSSMSRNSRRG